MYKLLDTLSLAETDALIKLHSDLELSSEINIHGKPDNSQYLHTNWFDWSSIQRGIFRKGFKENVISNAVQCWFLELPKETGFLDKQEYWNNKKESCGKVIAIALRNQTIVIGDEEVQMKKGQTILFCLSNTHQLNKSKHGQLWACVMVRKDPSHFS